MTNTTDKDNKLKSRPDEAPSIDVSSHLVIKDKDTGEILVNKAEK